MESLTCLWKRKRDGLALSVAGRLNADRADQIRVKIEKRQGLSTLVMASLTGDLRMQAKLGTVLDKR